jgi:hypothetical protein
MNLPSTNEEGVNANRTTELKQIVNVFSMKTNCLDSLKLIFEKIYSGLVLVRGKAE